MREKFRTFFSSIEIEIRNNLPVWTRIQKVYWFFIRLLYCVGNGKDSNFLPLWWRNRKRWWCKWWILFNLLINLTDVTRREFCWKFDRFLFCVLTSEIIYSKYKIQWFEEIFERSEWRREMKIFLVLARSSSKVFSF